MNTGELKKLLTEAISKSSNRLELWNHILDRVERNTLCEIGVWKGDFAKHLLDNVQGIHQYILVDPWRNLPTWNKPANVSNERFDAIRKEALRKNSPHLSKIRELRMTTKEAVLEIENESIDFAYVDADHSLRGITIDLHSILPCIKPNGLIGGDDFTKNIWQHGEQYDPTEVFPYAIYFAEAHNVTIFSLPFNQFLILKNGVFEFVDLANYASLSTEQIYRNPRFSVSNVDDRNILWWCQKALNRKQFVQEQHMREFVSPAGYTYKSFDDTKSIFVHVPKTAGISLSRTLYGNLSGGHTTLAKYAEIFEPDLIQEYFKFTIVRNPFDRIVSV